MMIQFQIFMFFAMLSVSFGCFSTRTAEAQVNKHLYSESADPAADIAAAQRVARREHK